MGWVRSGAIREQISILVMYTFGMGIYDIQFSSILWTRLIIIFIILGNAILIFPAQINQILQLASPRCGFLEVPLLDNLELRFCMKCV